MRKAINEIIKAATSVYEEASQPCKNELMVSYWIGRLSAFSSTLYILGAVTDAEMVSDMASDLSRKDQEKRHA